MHGRSEFGQPGTVPLQPVPHDDHVGPGVEGLRGSFRRPDAAADDEGQVDLPPYAGDHFRRDGLLRSAARVHVDEAHTELLAGQGGGGGDGGLIGGNGRRVAHVGDRRGLAAVDEQVARGHRFELHAFEAAGDLDVAADEQIGVAAGEEAEQENGVGVSVQLVGGAGEEDDGDAGAGLQQAEVELGLGGVDEAAAPEKEVDVAGGGVVGQQFQVVLPGLVRVDENGQQFAAGCTGLGQGGIYHIQDRGSWRGGMIAGAKVRYLGRGPDRGGAG